MKYSLKEIEKALIFGQKNPNATLDDFLDYESRVITKKELSKFSDFTYDKVILELEGKEYEFIVFSNQSDYLNLEKLPSRIAGKKPHYILTPMPGCWYDGVVVLHIPKDKNNNFFTINKWPEFKGNKGLHVIGNKKLQFSFILQIEGDKEGDIFCRNGDIINKHLSKTHYKLWDNQSELHGYVNTSLFNFKPVDDLFEIID